MIAIRTVCTVLVPVMLCGCVAEIAELGAPPTMSPVGSVLIFRPSARTL